MKFRTLGVALLVGSGLALTTVMTSSAVAQSYPPADCDGSFGTGAGSGRAAAFGDISPIVGCDENGDDRNGRDNNGYGEDRDNGGYGENGGGEAGYDQNGGDEAGYDENGGGEAGYDENGGGEAGYDENGGGEAGYDENGGGEAGYDENGGGEAGYDENGYDENGYDENGYDKNGYDKKGNDKDEVNWWKEYVYGEGGKDHENVGDRASSRPSEKRSEGPSERPSERPSGYATADVKPTTAAPSVAPVATVSPGAVRPAQAKLPFTGVETGALAVIAVALVGGGLLIRAAARKHRNVPGARG